MGKRILLQIIIVMCSCIALGQNKNVAWIESDFANSIMDSKKVSGKYLFSIEGFQKINGHLFILTYHGELTKVNYRKITNGYEIINFGYLINLNSWPKSIADLYSKAIVTFYFEGEDMCLTIKTSKGIEKRRYISNLRGNRFATILEIEGWLLTYLVPNIFE